MIWNTSMKFTMALLCHFPISEIEILLRNYGIKRNKGVRHINSILENTEYIQRIWTRHWHKWAAAKVPFQYKNRLSKCKGNKDQTIVKSSYLSNANFLPVWHKHFIFKHTPSLGGWHFMRTLHWHTLHGTFDNVPTGLQCLAELPQDM